MELDARRSIEDMDELKRTVPVLVGSILLFFAHQQLHLEPATVALAGATVMLLVSRQSLEKSLAGIEWPTLFFFIGLFVMVGALEERGAIAEVADGIADLTAGNRTAELLGITWASAIGSGIVDNIPFTAAMIPVVEQLQEGNGGDDAYWWALSLGACFGGNATIIAAAANVAAAGMAARAGRPIGFVTFLKIGLPATVRLARPRHRLHRPEVPVSPRTPDRPALARGPDPHRRPTRSATPSAIVLDTGLPALPVDRRRRRATAASSASASSSPPYFPATSASSSTPASSRARSSARSRSAPAARSNPSRDWMNTEHVDVGPDFSDAQVAEIFLHHRVLLVPVVDDHRVLGVITRNDFFRALAERVLEA